MKLRENACLNVVGNNDNSLKLTKDDDKEELVIDEEGVDETVVQYQKSGEWRKCVTWINIFNWRWKDEKKKRRCEIVN